jgi:hypothetical protein
MLKQNKIIPVLNKVPAMGAGFSPKVLNSKAPE